MSQVLRAGGFDYADLPAEVAVEAREVADRVREAHARTVQTVIAMGRELLRVKGKLTHGQFGRWLDAEFGGGARTAQNYMSAAERFADKSETVSYLPTTTVYQLASPSTPEKVRHEVVALAEAGSPLPAHEVDYRIRLGRDDARKAKLAAQKRELRTPEGQAKRQTAFEKRQAKLERERVAREAALAEAYQALAAFLRAELGAKTADFLALLRATEPPYGGASRELATLLGSESP